MTAYVLTAAGERVYADHMAFTQFCQAETLKLLEGFTDQELEAHLKVQRRLNQAYQADVRRSRELFRARNGAEQEN